MNNKTSQLLDGQTAIVTGAASGIGRATCLSLVQKGATVVLVDINGEHLEETAQELKAQECSPEPMILKKDIRSERHMDEMARLTLERFGGIDVLVHCAAILRGTGSGPKNMADVSLAEWDEVMETNLKGTFLCNRAVLPAMMNQRRGQIINISSTSGLRGHALDSVYCASKFGVFGLSQSLAEEVRPYGIRVFVVQPDAVDTPMWDQNGPIRAPTDALSPARVADLITYLVSLPGDTILGGLVISPFRTRRRKKPESRENS
jgi:NAD(P)-dependent dehydrogenase (short-subunit alcohol dehydrogenase family)